MLELFGNARDFHVKEGGCCTMIQATRKPNKRNLSSANGLSSQRLVVLPPTPMQKIIKMIMQQKRLLRIDALSRVT